jgi:hypothetical protein
VPTVAELLAELGAEESPSETTVAQLLAELDTKESVSEKAKRNLKGTMGREKMGPRSATLSDVGRDLLGAADVLGADDNNLAFMGVNGKKQQIEAPKDLASRGLQRFGRGVAGGVENVGEMALGLGNLMTPGAIAADKPKRTLGPRAQAVADWMREKVDIATPNPDTNESALMQLVDVPAGAISTLPFYSALGPLKSAAGGLVKSPAGKMIAEKAAGTAGFGALAGMQDLLSGLGSEGVADPSQTGEAVKGGILAGAINELTGPMPIKSRVPVSAGAAALAAPEGDRMRAGVEQGLWSMLPGEHEAKAAKAKAAEFEAKARDRAMLAQQNREIIATKEAERQAAEQQKREVEQQKAAQENQKAQEQAEREQIEVTMQMIKHREIEEVARGAAATHPTPEAASKAAQREFYDRRVAAGEIGIEVMSTAKAVGGYARDLHEMAQPAEMPVAEEGPPPRPNPQALNLLKSARPDQATARIVDQAILKGFDSLSEGQQAKIHEALRASGVNPDAFSEAPPPAPPAEPWGPPPYAAGAREVRDFAPGSREISPHEQLWYDSGGLRGMMPPEMADVPTPQARHQQEIQGLEFDPREFQEGPNAARQIPQQEGPAGEAPPGVRADLRQPDDGGGNSAETPGATQREIDVFPEQHREKATVFAKQIRNIKGLQDMGAHLTQDFQGNPVIKTKSGRVVPERDVMRMRWDEPC